MPPIDGKRFAIIFNMSVLILKNIYNEGPGTLEDFLRKSNIEYVITDLHAESIPSTKNVDMLVILGGPMSVNDADDYPYIAQEIALVKEFVSKQKKVLGICLGAQIIAKAFGAEVYAGRKKEIGWYDIEIIGNNIMDSLMNKLAFHSKTGDYCKKFKVFHWHGETFDIPEGADHLARSELYPNQAFNYGPNVYAFQFHIEVKKEMIFEWLRNEPVDIEKLSKETDIFYKDYADRAENFYKLFFCSR